MIEFRREGRGMQDITVFLRCFRLVSLCFVSANVNLPKASSQLFCPTLPRAQYIFGYALTVNEWAGAVPPMKLCKCSPSPSLPFLLLSPFGGLQWDDDRNQLTGNIISSALVIGVGKCHGGWVKLAPIHIRLIIEHINLAWPD